MRKILSIIVAAVLCAVPAIAGSWVRINQLGYIPNSTKVAVYVSNDEEIVLSFDVVEVHLSPLLQIKPQKEKEQEQKSFNTKRIELLN